MRNPFKSILKVFLSLWRPKVYLTIGFILFGLLSCSSVLSFKKVLPEKIKYSQIEFVDCNSPENEEYLCLRKEHAVNSVLDLKKCQEQNKLLRQLLNGS
jgi:hypothetical protein